MNNYKFDLHNVSSHEAGHLFFLEDVQKNNQYHVDKTELTMYYTISSAETKKRDLHGDDKYAAWLMYGCRNGQPC